MQLPSQKLPIPDPSLQHTTTWGDLRRGEEEKDTHPFKNRRTYLDAGSCKKSKTICSIFFCPPTLPYWLESWKEKCRWIVNISIKNSAKMNSPVRSFTWFTEVAWCPIIGVLVEVGICGCVVTPTPCSFCKHKYKQHQKSQNI